MRSSLVTSKVENKIYVGRLDLSIAAPSARLDGVVKTDTPTAYCVKIENDEKKKNDNQWQLDHETPIRWKHNRFFCFARNKCKMGTKFSDVQFVHRRDGRSCLIGFGSKLTRHQSDKFSFFSRNLYRQWVRRRRHSHSAVRTTFINHDVRQKKIAQIFNPITSIGFWHMHSNIILIRYTGSDLFRIAFYHYIASPGMSLLLFGWINFSHNELARNFWQFRTWMHCWHCLRSLDLNAYINKIPYSRTEFKMRIVQCVWYENGWGYFLFCC